MAVHKAATVRVMQAFAGHQVSGQEVVAVEGNGWMGIARGCVCIDGALLCAGSKGRVLADVCGAVDSPSWMKRASRGVPVSLARAPWL